MQVFPLLAALHYLIRSNGVVRVIETGTARGVSAACLASAVAHRSAGAWSRSIRIQTQIVWTYGPACRSAAELH